MREYKEPKSFGDVVEILSNKMDGVEVSLSQRIGDLDTNIDGVEVSLSQRIGDLDTKIDGVEVSLFKSLSKKIDDLDTKIDGVEASLSKKINGVEESLGGAIDILALQIHGINTRLDGIDGRLEGVDARLDGHDTRFDLLEEGLDRRFANLHGDMMQVIGMENDKVLTVVDLLHEKDVITPAQRHTIRLMKPFPKR